MRKKFSTLKDREGQHGKWCAQGEKGRTHMENI